MAILFPSQAPSSASFLPVLWGRKSHSFQLVKVLSTFRRDGLGGTAVLQAHLRFSGLCRTPSLELKLIRRQEHQQAVHQPPPSHPLGRSCARAASIRLRASTCRKWRAQIPQAGPENIFTMYYQALRHTAPNAALPRIVQQRIWREPVEGADIRLFSKNAKPLAVENGSRHSHTPSDFTETLGLVRAITTTSPHGRWSLSKQYGHQSTCS